MDASIVGYRDWAQEIYERVRVMKQHRVLHYDSQLVERDLVFLVGWSEIVPEEFYRDRHVYVLHPSPLPAYRGGSPLQHQIMAGEECSRVSIFRLLPEYPEVDSGPLAFQSPWFPLGGDLGDVLSSVVIWGVAGIDSILNIYEQQAEPVLAPQVGEPTVFQRRKPEESEITPDELKMWSARSLYNKIRALQDPYPNAYIATADGQRLYLTGAHL